MKRTKQATGLPIDVESLRVRIQEAYSDMPKRLRQAARYALNNPNDMALERLATLAERSGVQPSTFVRLAKVLGFDGASQLQKIYREELYITGYNPSYDERVRRFSEETSNEQKPMARKLLEDFSYAGVVALEHLVNTTELEKLDQAIALIEAARAVHVMGMRRSFPVATYASYALYQAHKPVFLVDAVGGLLPNPAKLIGSDDLLLAISFRNYSEETVSAAREARNTGARIIAVTDSITSPLAEYADVTFEVVDSEVHGFRSLTATMCLVQSLVIGFAHSGLGTSPHPHDVKKESQNE